MYVTGNAFSKNIIAISSVTAARISFIITAAWWFIFTLPMLRNVEQIHGKKYEKIEIKKSLKE